MNREDDAAHDAGQAQDTQAGHDALYHLEVIPLAQEVIERHAQRHGQQRHEQNVLEHPPGIHINLSASQPQHQQRRHEGRQTSANRRHAHAVCHVALAQEAHDVAAHTTRTAAYQNDSQCQLLG